MPTTNIHESEWEVADTELRIRRRNRGEFDFKERVESLSGPGIQPLVGTVTVLDRSTGKSRSYRTGHGTSWVVDFARDIDVGLFLA